MEDNDTEVVVTFWRENIKQLEMVHPGDKIDISDITVKQLDEGRFFFNSTEATQLLVVSINWIMHN